MFTACDCSHLYQNATEPSIQLEDIRVHSWDITFGTALIAIWTKTTVIGLWCVVISPGFLLPAFTFPLTALKIIPDALCRMVFDL